MRNMTLENLTDENWLELETFDKQGTFDLERLIIEHPKGIHTVKPLKEPIKVDVYFDGTEMYALNEEFNITGFGVTVEDAMQDITLAAGDLYRELNTVDITGALPIYREIRAKFKELVE